MPTTVENQRKLIVGAGIVIAILMGIIAMLLFNKFGADKTIEKQKTEISEAQLLNKELQDEYDNAIAELDEALAENEDLRTVIEEQKAELTKQKNKISRAINSGASDKKALTEARSQLDELRTQQASFLARIDELEEQNQLLTNEIVQVKEEKKIVEEAFVNERDEKIKITTTKDSIISDVSKKKDELEEQKNYLEDKVEIGSIIKVEQIEVEGFKLKSGGKMVKKRYAKNVDVLKICYTATDNKVADEGREQFLVRVITPLGETMFIESLGSGSFTNKDSGEDMRYTKAQDVPYKNKSTNQCMNWKPDTPFAKGNYQVELYNKGYLAGKGEFRLK